MYLSVFEKEMKILPSVCDGTGRLSIPDTFALFMDMATEHADALGIGLKDLAKDDLFWLTVKTKVRFLKRPKMGDTVLVSTWPEAPQLLRCNRDYAVSADGETILAGKTEWAVMNMKTGKLGDLIFIDAKYSSVTSGAPGSYVYDPEYGGGTDGRHLYGPFNGYRYRRTHEQRCLCAGVCGTAGQRTVERDDLFRSGSAFLFAVL